MYFWEDFFRSRVLIFYCFITMTSEYTICGVSIWVVRTGDFRLGTAAMTVLVETKVLVFPVRSIWSFWRRISDVWTERARPRISRLFGKKRFVRKIGNKWSPIGDGQGKTTSVTVQLTLLSRAIILWYCTNTTIHVRTIKLTVNNAHVMLLNT